MKHVLLKILQYGIFVSVSLATLLALVVAVENFRARCAWESYRRDQEARGNRLDIKAIIPPPVPDDQNFATTPLLRPLFPDGQPYASDLGKKLDIAHPGDNSRIEPRLGNRASRKRFKIEEWRAFFDGRDVLAALGKFDPELREISAASRRPYARFPVAYEKSFFAPFPHVSILMKLAKIYALRASAGLQERREDASLADAQTIFKISESVKDEPALISLLVGGAVCDRGLQVVWEGLEDHRWTDAQLLALEDALQRIDFLKGVTLAFRGERTFYSETLLSWVAKPEQMAKAMEGVGEPEQLTLKYTPRAVIYRNLIAANRELETFLLSVDPEAHRVFPARVREVGESLIDGAYLQFFKRCGLTVPNPYTILTKMCMPAFLQATQRAASFQTSTDEAVIACALERFRLANGQYPDALEKLSPSFLQKIPRDVMTGEMLHYRPTNDGKFLLYSVGMNGSDDGGKVVLKANGSVDLSQGDWVW
jgi:hypothetical protein